MKGREKVIKSRVLLASLFGSVLLLAAANNGRAENDHSIVVREAQTLEQLIQEELQTTRFTKNIAEYNGIAAGTSIIPVGTTIKIPEPYMQQRNRGQVVFAKGDVVHKQKTLVVNPPVKGAYVYKGDVFATGADGFVSLKFSSGSVANVQPDSRVSVQDIACVDEKVSCVISLYAEQGEIESQVTPSPDGQPPVEFTVTTPFLSAAVRGTSFYVDVDQAADRIGVTEGLVATEVAGNNNELPKGKGLMAEANVEPEIVDLLQPPELMLGEGAVTYSAEDTVRWKVLQAAQRYRLTIARDEALTEPLMLKDTQENSSLLIEEMLPGSYHLSVAGIDNKEFLGLPVVKQFTFAEITDQEQLEIRMTRTNGVVNIEPVEYTGTLELLVSNALDNPTDEQRLIQTLSGGLSLELDVTQDWVFRVRKIFSPTSVSVYSDYYVLQAEQ